MHNKHERRTQNTQDTVVAVGGGWWRWAVSGPLELSLRAVLNKKRGGGVLKDSPGANLLRQSVYGPGPLTRWS